MRSPYRHDSRKETSLDDRLERLWVHRQGRDDARHRLYVVASILGAREGTASGSGGLYHLYICHVSPVERNAELALDIEFENEWGWEWGGRRRAIGMKMTWR
jgi:hypothetical protein